MNDTILIIITLVVLSAIGLAFMLHNAPKGREDNNGFHYGWKK